MMKYFLNFLLLISFSGISQNYLKPIDSLLTSKFNNGPAISVLISKNFEPTYSLFKGYADIENTVFASPESKFRIGSLTKQFTAIAILNLMEEGELSLDDSIQTYLPTFPTKSHTITIEHLLTHTSGLKEVTETEDFFSTLTKLGCEPETLVNYFKDYPLSFEPGSKFQYSNSGYHLLGLIIEKVSGQDYGNYLKTELFEKADMKNTLVDNDIKLIQNRASGYEKVNEEIINSTYIDMSIPFSAGNLLSTTEDINKWYKALFEYKIINKQNLEKAHTRYILNDGQKSNYGYGWFIDKFQGEKIITHEGGINGFLSSVIYIPNKQTLTILLSNCMCNPTAYTTKEITAYSIGKPLPRKKKVKLAMPILEKYEGDYMMQNEVWSIRIKNNKLYLKFENGSGYPIFAINEEEFFAEEWDAKFIFKEKDNNIEFRLIYSGGKVIGEKI
jgi:CubicO group peptidase (beta-lactamase class C family)